VSATQLVIGISSNIIVTIIIKRTERVIIAGTL